MENVLNRSIETIDRDIEKLKKERFLKQIETHKKKFPFYDLQLQENRYMLEDILNRLAEVNNNFLHIVECIDKCILEDKLNDWSREIKRNGDLLNEICTLQIECAKNYLIEFTDLQRICKKGKESLDD